MTKVTLSFRSEFSLGESTLSPKDIVRIAKSFDQTHIVVADTMNVCALIPLTKAAKSAGLEVVAGCRLRVVPDVLARGKGCNRGAVYPKVFPRNEAGMEEIYALVSRAYAPDRFFQISRLGVSDLIEILSPENVIITTGDVDGLLSNPKHGALDSLVNAGFAVVAELIPAPLPYYERVNHLAIAAADRYGLSTLTLHPTFFEEGGYEAFSTNHAVQNRGVLTKDYTISKPWTGFHAHQLKDVVINIGETLKGMRLIDAAHTGKPWQQGLAGAADFVSQAAYRWEKLAVSLPSLAADPNAALVEACRAGMRQRLFTDVFGYKPTLDQIRDVYVPRLNYELGVLKALGFADYFLVTADLCQWSKSNGVLMGPGRGSVGGSLVAYLMGITDVDPIRFDLIFERFINPSRNDLPDADLDFMSSRRDVVLRYLVGRYGQDYVAGINNYGSLQAASSVNAVLRVHGINANDVTATKLIPKVHGVPVSLEEAFEQVADIQRFAAEKPQVWKTALKMQGVMNMYGQHAAGTIISGTPLTKRAVVETRNGAHKVNWDKDVCEDQGLVKMDILGLSTLDILGKAVENIRVRRGVKVDLSSISLEDEAVLDNFGQGKTVGIFQVEGGAARRILKDMAAGSPLTFNDIVATNALNRPGPIEAGLVQQYIDSRNGGSIVGVPHPNMAAALEETFNVIVYQEQVMRISVDLCGFSLSDADVLRKAIGKKSAELMAKMEDKFVTGAVEVSGMDRKAAEALWEQIVGFAAYSFNKSHSCAYSLISYQSMWLKTHYPVEFYAAAMSVVSSEKLPLLVADAKNAGITVMPPDINISTDSYEIVTDTMIYAPLSAIKGVSENTARAIVAARGSTKFGSVEDLISRVPGRACNSGQRAAMDAVGAFSRIVPGQIPADSVDRLKDQMDLLPGVMTGFVLADRTIPNDKYTMAYLRRIIDDMEAVNLDENGEKKPQREQTIFVRPTMGDRAKFMVVTDAPNRSEEMAQQFTAGEGFGFTASAMIAAELNRRDAYFTGLLKRRKSGKIITPQEIKEFGPILDREVELLKPPLILALGSAAARHFVPDIKGSIDDYVGRTFWDKKRDATILIGINPGIIYVDPDRFDQLAEIFELARHIVGS